MSDVGRRTSEDGFTLIEMIAVIAILAVVMTVAAVRIDYMVPKYELRGAARGVAYHAKRARFQAASTGKDVYFKYDLPNGKYWMLVAFPKRAEEGEEPREGEAVEYEYQKVMDKKLPDGVKFVNVIQGSQEAAASGVATVRISPFGSANHLIVNLQNDGGRWMALKVNGFTGAVSFFDRQREADKILEDAGP